MSIPHSECKVYSIIKVLWILLLNHCIKSFKKQLTNGIACSKIILVLEKWTHAIVAQLVERHLAKVEIAGSSPVYRSSFYTAESHKMWGSAVFCVHVF